MRKTLIAFLFSLTLGMAAGYAMSRSDVSADAKHFHGFCKCGCSPTPNCNTSADCGGAVCGRTISCC